MYSDYEIILPPLEIFRDEHAARIGWDRKSDRLYEGVIELPSEGIIWYPKRGARPMNGFIFSLAVNASAIYKKLLMLWLRRLTNPIQWLFWKRAMYELHTIGRVTVAFYHLKPHYYSRPVREMYRLGMLVSGDWELVHDICSVFEWDTAYRYRLQLLLERVYPSKLKENPKKEILRVLQWAIDNESVDDMGSKWRAIRRAFMFAWYIPKIHGIIKTISQSIQLSEFFMDESDTFYCFAEKVLRLEVPH